MTKVDCLYSGKCSDYKKLCESCIHNELRSYYQSKDSYYWYPYYPLSQPLNPLPCTTVAWDTYTDMSDESYY